MTHLHDRDSWPGAVWAAVQAAGGVSAAAAAVGVTPTRLSQMANPNLRYWRALETYCRLDAAAAARGGVSPLFEAWRGRHSALGSFPDDARAARSAVLAAAARRFAAAVRAALAAFEAALDGPPRLQPVRARG